MNVYAVGDGATGGSDSLALANMIVKANPDAFLYLGDVYESGSISEFAVNYKPSWGQLDDKVKPIPGNHDYPNYTTGYSSYFSSQTAGNSFYTFALDGWQFYMLNSEEAMDPTSPQYQFVKEHLDTSTRKNIACWHRPRYCSGSHGDAIDTDPLWQLLGPNCPIILSGHAHNMQQFKPDTTGCVQIVSGAGGRGLYAEIPDDPRLEWGEANGYGALMIKLGSPLILNYVSEIGEVYYSTIINV